MKNRETYLYNHNRKVVNLKHLVYTQGSVLIEPCHSQSDCIHMRPIYEYKTKKQSKNPIKTP